MSNAGQVAFAVVGGVVGTFMGNPLLGVSIGMTLGGMLFPTTSEQSTDPGKPMDVKVQSSQYGSVIPVVVGTRKIAGNVIWYGNAQSTLHEEEVGGGKGGGGSQTTSYYTYSVSLAIGICNGGNTITKIWQDKTQIYPSGSPSATIRIYNGSQTEADSHVSNYVARNPVWKNLTYIVIENLQLGQTTRIPNFLFEVASSVTMVQPTYLGKFIDYIAESQPSYGCAALSNEVGADIYVSDSITTGDGSQLRRYTAAGVEIGPTINKLSNYAYGYKMVKALIKSSGSALIYRCDQCHRSDLGLTRPTSGSEYTTAWTYAGSGAVANMFWINDHIYLQGNINMRFVAIDLDNNYIFVADGSSHTCNRWNLNTSEWDGRIGVGEVPAGWPGINVHGITDIYVYNSELYIAYYDSAKALSGIEVFNTVSGDHQRTIGSRGGAAGQFTTRCAGVAANSKYVFGTDTTDNNINVYTLAGVFVTTFGTGVQGSGELEFYNPQQLAADENFLYIMDAANQRGKIMDMDGNFIAHLDRQPGTLGGGGTSISISEDRVFIAETYSKSIYYWSKPVLTANDVTTPPDVSNFILTDDLWGLGLDEATYINTTDQAATKAFCQSNDLFVSMLFDRQLNVLDALQYLLSHHDGFIKYIDGKISHLQMKEETPVGILSTANNDLVRQENKLPIDLVKAGDRDYNNKIIVEYTKAAKDYVKGTALADDLIDIDDYGMKDATIELDGLTTFARGSILANLMLRKNLSNPEKLMFKLGLKNLTMEPGQVWTLTDPDTELSSVDVRIINLREGTDYLIEVEAQEEINVYDYLTYGSDESDQGEVPDLISSPNDVVRVILIEIPPLYLAQNSETLLSIGYTAPNQESFAGASAYVSYSAGGTYTKAGFGGGGVTGVVDALGIDNYTNYIDVVLDSTAVLSSATSFDELIQTPNLNLMIVKSDRIGPYDTTAVDGNSDIFVRYQDVELIAANTWRLSGLIYDTVDFPQLNTYGDISVSDEIAINSRIPISLLVPDANLNYTYFTKVASYNHISVIQDLSGLSYDQYSFMWKYHRPLPPWGITIDGVGIDISNSITIDDGSDIIITWKSRNRFNAGGNIFTDPNAIVDDSDFDTFLLNMSGGSAERDVEQDAKTYTYTSAQQSTDGVTNIITFEIKQRGIWGLLSKPITITVNLV